MPKKDLEICRIIEQKLKEEYQKGDFRFTNRGADLCSLDIFFKDLGDNFEQMSIEAVISAIDVLGLELSEFIADVHDRYLMSEKKRIEEKLSQMAEYDRLLFAIQDFSRIELLDLIDYADCMRE